MDKGEEIVQQRHNCGWCGAYLSRNNGSIHLDCGFRFINTKNYIKHVKMCGYREYPPEYQMKAMR